MKKIKIKLTYLTDSWTHGVTYDEGCGMCQQQGKSGLFRMMMLPTTLVKLEVDGEEKQAYLCKSCIDRGIKGGQLKATNEQPGNCPFSMGE